MSTLPIVTATLILIAGAVDDLRSRKVHNELFLACTAIAVAVTVLMGGLSGLASAGAGFAAGLAVLLPFVLMKMIGAGDMKLLAAAGAVVGWSAVIDIGIYSLFWGAVFGVLQVVLKGQWRATLNNMVAIATFKAKQSEQPLELHRMPFTIALLLGWFSHLVRGGVWQ